MNEIVNAIVQYSETAVSALRNMKAKRNTSELSPGRATAIHTLDNLRKDWDAATSELRAKYEGYE
jgi:hypothetical protein